MECDTHKAFIDFRDGIGAERIAAELGEFGPAGRMLDLVAVVEADRS